MKKRIATFLLLLLILISFLEGCWSRTELNELAIVLGAGVDLTTSGQIQLTLQIAIPKAFAGGEGGGGKGKEAASWVISAEGKTIDEAEGYLAKKVPRKIYWGNCNILVIGDQMARKGICPVTDFFLREGQTRESMSIIVTKGKAKDFLETSSVLANTSVQAVEVLSRRNSGYSVPLWEFAEMLENKGVEPVASWVSIQQTGSTPGADKGNSPADNQAVFSGVAVFKGDKLIGWLNANETMGLLWLKGETMKGTITVPSPAEPDKMISIQIRQGSTEVIPEYDGKNLFFKVNLKVEGDVLDEQSHEDLTKTDKIKALEEEMAAEVKKRTTAVLEKAQREYGVDIFGFGNAFHRSYKVDWRGLKDRWDEKFTQAKVKISVEAHVRDIGLLGKGVNAVGQ
ncbi:germination protein, Ger(x)C family [Acididesulfobacillus acetoxydans]|uniref:Germination protein, Ger(X)C n=1 Tax=Acididesulfobacillus acetoxydans TaxID=1561005 RepID=A0A8S0WIG7_9FIRM|nr:Ger(x)C family spore germination protein [Acididesulfobacillus acetoxydans]CAA7603332.1 germination protein, Ger(x)C family [Acididesulfobacillus acetoxydans]CEJ09675.1 Germination protein, Ger(X)C [Acididesulfobacillus acetoxydans]